MSEREFKAAVERAAEAAAAEANDADVAGDPATHVTAYVDGRTGFVRDFKAYGDETRSGRYEVGPVSVRSGSDGYVLSISGLKGTNIQNHKKKRLLYETFEEEMADAGWNMSLELSQYAR